MTHDVRSLREFLADLHAIDADVDVLVLGVQEWLRQPGIVAIMYEGLIESGTQMLTGAQLALIREACQR